MSTRDAVVFGLSEVASATAYRLRGAGWRVVLACARPPKVHRRAMAFADVWWDGTAVLAGLACVRTDPHRIRRGAWPAGNLPFVALGVAEALALSPWALAVDARLAKRSAPLALRARAGLSLGCGPGHVAGRTCDLAIETQWGADLGMIRVRGPTAALSGEPKTIEGVGRERIVYAPAAGRLRVLCAIGDPVAAGETVAFIGMHSVAAPIAGTLRGILRDGLEILPGDKLCEVDPRPENLAQFSGIGLRPATIATAILRAVEATHLRVSDFCPEEAPIPEGPMRAKRRHRTPGHQAPSAEDPAARTKPSA